MDQADCVVVGAGVVGLAVARALALVGREVLVIDAAATFGTGISARNSEVIHAGLYYPADSLKARTCVAGRERLYAYCAERGIAHRRCGKFVVATCADQLATLEAIRAAGLRNGVVDLRLLSRAEARSFEPELECAAALHSPSTGIVDSHALMLALQGDAEHAGACFAFNSPVTGGSVDDAGIVLDIGGRDPMQLRARWLVNCAGLGAVSLARALHGFPADRVPAAYFAKGNYFALGTRSPFRRLVYPVPEPGGLGVHLTIDLAGRTRFGPDVEWVEPRADGSLDFGVDPTRGDRFYAEVRKYWPGLADGTLHADYAGIRPKIHGPGEPMPDFRIDGPDTHGVNGVVHLSGIESPGLTAALALADEVLARMGLA